VKISKKAQKVVPGSRLKMQGSDSGFHSHRSNQRSMAKLKSDKSGPIANKQSIKTMSREETTVGGEEKP